METKPTPGPWRAVAIPEGGGAVRWYVLADDDEEPWMIATIENGRPGDTLATERATAHAMAAADMLLIACEVALQSHLELCVQLDDCPTTRRLEAAISKGRGRG